MGSGHHQHQQHINMFDLEEERREAARIIEKVNKKAKEIRGKIGRSPRGEESEGKMVVPSGTSSNIG